jgi:predicted methyltransferase
MFYNKLIPLSLALTFLLAGCGPKAPEAPAAPEAAASAPAAAPLPPSEPAFDLAASLASDARSEEDRARDAGRKPVEVLALLGIEPGMDVIDLMAAGGWYSEVLSHAVGPDGTVTAQNSPLILSFRDGAYGVDLDKRIGDRLTNVTRLDSAWADLATLGPRYDAAISALNFHDAYYLESPEAAAEMAAAVYAVLKPGGVFGIIDHVGSPDGANDKLHRIDKALVIDIATAAGFSVEADSGLLANPADDHTQGVFSDGIRGKTDRFLLKLRKPAM